jgi:hypothetical protein
MSDQRIDRSFSSDAEETAERHGSVRRGAWYADPYGSSTALRWWDGTKWTEEVPETSLSEGVASPSPPDGSAHGWYDVPDRPNTKGYWDGQRWTGEYAPSMSLTPRSTPAVTSESQSAGTLVVAGYIMAVLLPLLGFILGMIATTRPAKATARQGPWIIAVSVAAFVIYLFLLRTRH